jgi:hypothetical protein
MSKVTWEDRERRRIQKAAREYRKKGYTVIIEPGVHDLPNFLAVFV